MTGSTPHTFSNMSTQTIDAVGNLHDTKGQFAGHVQVEGDPASVLTQTAAVMCDRCEGPWGEDLTCARCTTEDGDVRPVDQPGPLFTEDPKDLAAIRRAEEARWGDVSSVREGSRTPWGEAQHVSRPAPGIAVASTAGHGGIKLSPERNAAVPPAFRNASGWYEEDCESHIVAWVHPEAFPHYLGGDLEAIRADARQHLIDGMPDEWEKTTGEEIPFGVSSEKDRRAWAEKVKGQTLLYGQNAQEHPDYPGMVVVTTKGPDGEFSRHMMPVADYKKAGSVVGYGAARSGCLQPVPASAIEVPEPKEPKKVRQPITRVSVAGMTPTMQSRATVDLDKRWRDGTGRTFTMREEIASGAYCGKTVTYDNQGKAEYHLRRTGDESRITPVSKAIWDAFQAEDERSPADTALAKWRSKQAATDRAARSYDRNLTVKLGKESQKLYEEYTRLRDEESAARKPAQEAAKAAREAADKAALDAAYAKAKTDGLV